MIPQVGQLVTAIMDTLPVSGLKQMRHPDEFIKKGTVLKIIHCKLAPSYNVYILEFSEMLAKFPKQHLYYYSSAFACRAVENPVKLWDTIVGK